MADVNGVSGAGNAAAGAANGQTAEQEAEFMGKLVDAFGSQLLMKLHNDPEYKEMMEEMKQNDTGF